MPNIYKKLWDEKMKDGKPPQFVRNVRVMPFKEFAEKVMAQDQAFAKDIVDSYYAGDAFVWTGAFTPKYLTDTKKKVFEYGKSTPESSFKVLDGCPNSHCAVDRKIGPVGGYTALDHSYYFFRWNKDELGLFKDLEKHWEAIKTFGGLAKDEYEKNIPSDKVVDRVQIIHYPSGSGEITVHKDPYWNQKAVFGVEMTQKGTDYGTGGVFLMTKEGKKRFMDKEHEHGSFVSFFPSVNHGVEAIDKDKPGDWKTANGRWYMTVNSIDSHHFADRRGALPPDKEWGDPQNKAAADSSRM